MMEKHIGTVLDLLGELQKIDPGFPLQYAVCLAEVARSEGLSLSALAEKTGMPLSTVSRIIGALSKKRQQGKPFDLIHVKISPRERRKKELYLTPRGNTVVQAMLIHIANK